MKWGALLLLLSCSPAISVQEAVPKWKYNRQFIGNRLGGNGSGIADNKPKNIPLIKQYENDPEFLNYEFDVNSAKDVLVVCHDATQGKKKVKDYKNSFWGYPTYTQTIDDLIKYQAAKLVEIDIKKVNYDHLEALTSGADKLTKAGIKNRFFAHCNKQDEKLIKKILELGYKVKFHSCNKNAEWATESHL